MLRISFALTKEAFLAGIKTETRRLGWRRLRAPRQLLAVSQGMGLKPGQSADVYGPITVIETEREPLNAITPEGVAREGFPDWTPAQFVAFFCQHHQCEPDKFVTRIRFKAFSQWCACGHSWATHKMGAFGDCYAFGCSCPRFIGQADASDEHCDTCGHRLDLFDAQFRSCSECTGRAWLEACGSCGHARVAHDTHSMVFEGQTISLPTTCRHIPAPVGVHCDCSAFVPTGRVV
jgi:hypothetical protein